MTFKDILLILTSYPDATPDAGIVRALSLAAAPAAYLENPPVPVFLSH